MQFIYQASQGLKFIWPWCDILQGRIKHPTWGSSENHRLKSALKRGYVMVPWRVDYEGYRILFLWNEYQHIKSLSKVIAEKLFPKSYHILPCTPIYIYIYIYSMCIFYSWYTCSGYTSLLSGVVSLLDFAGVESPHRSCDSHLYHGNPSCVKLYEVHVPQCGGLGSPWKKSTPLKTHMSPKKGTIFNKQMHLPTNHRCSGDMLVFPGVWLKGAFLFPNHRHC